MASSSPSQQRPSIDGSPAPFISHILEIHMTKKPTRRDDFIHTFYTRDNEPQSGTSYIYFAAFASERSKVLEQLGCYVGANQATEPDEFVYSGTRREQRVIDLSAEMDTVVFMVVLPQGNPLSPRTYAECVSIIYRGKIQHRGYHRMRDAEAWSQAVGMKKTFRMFEAVSREVSVRADILPEVFEPIPSPRVSLEKFFVN